MVIRSAKDAYKASMEARQSAIDKEIIRAMQAIKNAAEQGAFYCFTPAVSIQAKDRLTDLGYEVSYHQDGNGDDTCTISWLNADKN